MRVPRAFAFVDLSGFTQFTDLHGDDEAVAVLTQFRFALRATASDIGVRIEDDAVVTASGCEIITADAPKAIADIEALMRH